MEQLIDRAEIARFVDRLGKYGRTGIVMVFGQRLQELLILRNRFNNMGRTTTLVKVPRPLRCLLVQVAEGEGASKLDLKHDWRGLEIELYDTERAINDIDRKVAEYVFASKPVQMAADEPDCEPLGILVRRMRELGPCELVYATEHGVEYWYVLSKTDDERICVGAGPVPEIALKKALDGGGQ